MDFQNDQPIYIQIGTFIKEQIINGTIKPGEKLPSVREYAVLFEVSPLTIHRTIQYLEAEGIIVTRKGIGSFGDVSCFSFHATKVFNTIEGGAACYDDEDFGLELYRLKNFGIRGPERVDGVGANAKMNEFCAAMGICNLRHIDDEIAKRGVIVERYRSHLADVEGIQLNPVQEGVTPNYAYFPIVVDERAFGASRNEIFDELQRNGVMARKYFYPITSSYDCYHGRFNPNLTPVALHVSKRVLTLPLYADIRLKEVDRICDIICGLRRKCY